MHVSRGNPAATPAVNRVPLAAPLRFASIIESSEDAIVSKDLNGTILTWNRGAVGIYGYTAEEMVGQSIKLLVPPDRLDEEESILAQIQAGQRVQQFETIRIGKGGAPLHVSLTISPAGRRMTFLLPPGREGEEEQILEKIRRGERVDHFETTRLRKDGVVIHVSLSISPIRNREGAMVGASHVARDITGQKEFERQLRQTQSATPPSDPPSSPASPGTSRPRLPPPASPPQPRGTSPDRAA